MHNLTFRSVPPDLIIVIILNEWAKVIIHNSMDCSCTHNEWANYVLVQFNYYIILIILSLLGNSIHPLQEVLTYTL